MSARMAQSLRFLHVTTFYPPYNFGGDAIYVWRLANALAADGHLVDVVHCADSYELLAGKRPLPAPLTAHPNVKVFGLRGAPRALASVAAHQTGFPLLRRAQIARVTTGKQYDVVHYHNISMFGPGVLGLEVARKEPIKLYTVLEYWLVCANHLLWKFGRRACESRQCLQCVIRAKRPPQLWRYTSLLDWLVSKVDRFLAPSRTVARIHAERGFRPPMVCLPLFTEVPSVGELATLPRPFERPYFLFVGRLELLKGIDVLLAAWKRIEGADLVIAGDGSQAARLKQQLSGNPHIHLLGYVAQPQLAELYFHARASIVPSLNEEPFGLTAIEALAHRTPVIAHRIGGPAEIIDESGGGLLYKNEDELVQALGKLLADDSLRDLLGARGYRTCQDLWSKAAHLRRYYEVIREIAATRNAGTCSSRLAI
jgi:glycosyltransferase involved in cell wall biosynthesis